MEMGTQDGREKFLPYKIVYEAGEGEIVEKKSRFIASVSPAGSEQEAAAFIESIRKKHYDARHNCPALVINGMGLTDTVVVVTRYFGGILLGTGGLVRAYTEAAKAGLANAGIATMRYGSLLNISADYTDLGRIQYLLGNRRIPVLDSQYTDRVSLKLRVSEEDVDALLKELTESTEARAGIEILEKSYYMTEEA